MTLYRRRLQVGVDSPILARSWRQGWDSQLLRPCHADEEDHREARIIRSRTIPARITPPQGPGNGCEGLDSNPCTHLLQRQCHLQRSIQFCQLGSRQGPNKPCELYLTKTDEVVTKDPAFVLQTFIDSDRHLGRETVPTRQNRRADDGRKSGINQYLAAHHDEAAVKLRIVAGMMHAVDFASSHLCLAPGYSSVA
jgi:hypothetical protein